MWHDALRVEKKWNDHNRAALLCGLDSCQTICVKNVKIFSRNPISIVFREICNTLLSLANDISKCMNMFKQTFESVPHNKCRTKTIKKKLWPQKNTQPHLTAATQHTNYTSATLGCSFTTEPNRVIIAQPWHVRTPLPSKGNAPMRTNIYDKLARLSNQNQMWTASRTQRARWYFKLCIVVTTIHAFRARKMSAPNNYVVACTTVFNWMSCRPECRGDETDDTVLCF